MTVVIVGGGVFRLGSFGQDRDGAKRGCKREEHDDAGDDTRVPVRGLMNGEIVGGDHACIFVMAIGPAAVLVVVVVVVVVVVSGSVVWVGFMAVSLVLSSLGWMEFWFVVIVLPRRSGGSGDR